MAAIKLFISATDKLAFVGDLHFDIKVSSRLDDYMTTCCRKLEAVGDICQQENVRYIFFSGDIFHRINCPHEVVNRLGNVFLSLQRKGLRLFSICGNHDIPRDSLKNLEQSPIETLFLGLLEHISLATPVEIYKSYQDNSAIFSAKVTACDYTQSVLPADNGFDVNILLAHMFFDKPSFLSGDDQNITKDFMETLGYDMAFLGHDHEEYDPVVCGKTMVVRSGSLLRGTVHDYNFSREPGFVIVDDIFNPHSVRKVIIPHRPYQDIISQAALNRKAVNASVTDSINRDALRDLADKLANAKCSNEPEKDIILKTIEEDKHIPHICRRILLDYIHKTG